jgi:hypothetical protein
VNLTQLDFYHTCPRAFDKDATQVPANHPLRAIAKVLEVASQDYTVQIKCYRLTDCMAIDLLLRYGADRDIHIIIEDVPPEEVNDAAKNNTVKSLMKFLEAHKHVGSYAILRQIEIRVANTTAADNRYCCQQGYSSMHEKQIITDSHSVYGSYNLTGYARCKNYESIRISPSRREEQEAFAAHWNELGSNREISKLYPQIIPTVQRKKLRIH